MSTERILCINRGAYRFFFNARLTRELGLRGGERILIAKDEDSRADWYLSITDNQGARLRITRRDGSGEPASAVFYNKAAANEILNAVKAINSVSLFVAAKPTRMPDGSEWYRIMTAVPKRIR